MTSETANSNASPARRPKPRAEAIETGPPAGPETSRQQRRFLARKAVILDAALTLFSQSGLHGVSTEQIADAADVSKTNLFYYFSSKEEIYVGVLKRLLSDWLAPLDALDPEADPIQAIGDYVRLKMAMSRTDPHSSRLFCLEIVQGAPMIGDELKTSLKALVDRKAAVIRRWSEDGKIAAVDPHHLIYAIWATTQHYADFAVQIAAISGRTLDDETFFREATENVLRVVLGALATGAEATPPHAAG